MYDWTNLDPKPKMVPMAKRERRLGKIARAVLTTIVAGTTLLTPSKLNETVPSSFYNPNGPIVSNTIQGPKYEKPLEEPQEETNRQTDPVLEYQVREMSRYRDLLTEYAEINEIDVNFLTALSLVENAKVDPTAVSKTGCTGLYQFSRGTARMEGLKVTGHYDERRNPARSIPAAAQHLRKLKGRFGDDITRLLEEGYHGSSTIIKKDPTTGKSDTTIVRVPDWYVDRVLRTKAELDTGNYPFDEAVPLYSRELEQTYPVQVEANDTIYRIATEHRVPVERIMYLNPEVPTKRMRPGTILRIPK